MVDSTKVQCRNKFLRKIADAQALKNANPASVKEIDLTTNLLE